MNVTHRRRKNLAIVVAKSVTSPATVLTLVPTLAPELEWPPAVSAPLLTPAAVVVARSATSVGNWDTLHETAMRGLAVATGGAIRAKAVLAVEEVLVPALEGARARLAILAAVTVTCLVTVLKGRNATIVSIETPSPDHFKY